MNTQLKNFFSAFGNPWISKDGKQIFTVNIYFRPYDFWIGVYYNQLGKVIYFCPLPMVCIRIQLPCDFRTHE